MSLSAPENFVAKYFTKMPLWVRVVTYLTLLLLYVYNSLVPGFIYGEIRIEGENNQYDFYTLGQVCITVDGRDIQTDTDKKGKWALPLASKIPKNQKIRFSDREGNIDIEFQGIDVLRGKHLIVYYNTGSGPKFYIKDSEKSRENILGKLFNIFTISEAIAYNGEKNRNSTPDEVENTIINEIRKIISNLPENVDKNLNLFEKIGRSEEIRLKESIEQKFGIFISAKDWLRITTINDLINSVYSHQKSATLNLSNEIGYAYYGIQLNNGKWHERFFENKNQEKTARPKEGDIVVATGNVNIRSGYIEYKMLRGWINKDIIGLIKPGDQLFAEEVKTIAGNFVWIKFRRIKKK